MGRGRRRAGGNEEKKLESRGSEILCKVLVEASLSCCVRVYLLGVCLLLWYRIQYHIAKSCWYDRTGAEEENTVECLSGSPKLLELIALSHSDSLGQGGGHPLGGAPAVTDTVNHRCTFG